MNMDSALAASNAALGGSFVAVPALDKAKFVLVLDADLFGCPATGVANSRAWAKGRRIEESDASKQTQSRMYVAEPSVTEPSVPYESRSFGCTACSWSRS